MLSVASTLAVSPVAYPAARAASANGGGVQPLTPAQQQQVDQLKQIDTRVREHEAAHLRAGGSLVTSGPSYTYTYGPDGKQYAVGGEVNIDTSAERKPEDNIAKGQHIEAAALAPADPSAQDYRVAGVGAQLSAQGRADLAAEKQQESAPGAQGNAQGNTAANRVAQAYQPAQAVVGSLLSILA